MINKLEKKAQKIISLKVYQNTQDLQQGEKFEV